MALSTLTKTFRSSIRGLETQLTSRLSKLALEKSCKPSVRFTMVRLMKRAARCKNSLRTIHRRSRLSVTFTRSEQFCSVCFSVMLHLETFQSRLKTTECIRGRQMPMSTMCLSSRRTASSPTKCARYWSIFCTRALNTAFRIWIRSKSN